MITISLTGKHTGKHTGKQWEVVANPDSHEGGNAAGICSTEDDYIADVYMGYVGSLGITKAEQMANARLIAAAPELLEALKGLLGFISETRGIPAYNAVLDAQKAIAKAEGAQ
jgi:hypothetical protein